MGMKVSEAREGFVFVVEGIAYLGVGGVWGVGVVGCGVPGEGVCGLGRGGVGV